MSQPVWVMGGEQRVLFYEPKEWAAFKRALVVRVEDGRVERVLEYESPPAHRPDERPSHVFKAATIESGEGGEGGTAWLCTQTEVLVCDFPSFAIRRVISHPFFNDLHHVTPGPEGTLFVAVTGLDAVAELTPEGKVLRLVSVLGGSPWDRFSAVTDYRKVPTTKPHRAHPNFIADADRFERLSLEQRDAIPLPGYGACGCQQPFEIGVSGVHDGHVVGDCIHFTSVSGRLVSFDLRTGERTSLDLNVLGEPDDDRALGWCRGLLPDGDRAWVGFTRLRYTTLRRNLSWLRHGFRESEHHRQRPTRIARYDLARPALLAQVDLEPAGMGAVFSVHQG